MFGLRSNNEPVRHSTIMNGRDGFFRFVFRVSLDPWRVSGVQESSSETQCDSNTNQNSAVVQRFAA